jgi:hypothetical protein
MRFQRISTENKEEGIVEVNRKTEDKGEEASGWTRIFEKRYIHLFRERKQGRKGNN